MYLIILIGYLILFFVLHMTRAPESLRLTIRLWHNFFILISVKLLN